MERKTASNGTRAAESPGNPRPFHVSNQIPYLHLKNVDSELRAKVAAEDIPFAKAVAMDVFVEPAKGAVDFLAFRDVLRDLDYVGFGIVEQDMFPAPFEKPLPIAKRTRAYLREIGLG